VEGYTDLAAIAQAGFENAVASLGTAFTPNQARVLGRYTRRAFVSYDGDAAGSTAAIRSFDLLLARGFEVRVVDLPAGKDPDDYLKEEGAEAYGRLVRQAPGYLKYLVTKEARARNPERIEEKIEAVNAVLPHLVKLTSPIERVDWAGRLADALGIDDDLVQQELRAALKEAKQSIRRPAAGTKRTEAPRPVEVRLLSLLLAFEDLRKQARDRLEDGDLQGSRIHAIVGTILRLAAGGKKVDHPTLINALADEEDRDLVTRIAFRDEPEGRMEEFEDCLKALRRERLVRERNELNKVIARTADPSAVESLLVRTQDLARQIDALL
jgi:DNA primase